MAHKKIIDKAKRVRIQQRVIMLGSLCMMVGVIVWMITLVTSNDKLPQDDSSIKTVNVDRNASSDDSSNTSSENSSTTDESSAVDAEDDFSDACFIGDSRTVGLSMNSGKPMATFYCSTGLNVNTAVDSDTITLDNGTMGNVIDAVKQQEFKRIFIMFGINELGWPYPEVFQEEYEELITQIQTAQPDAKIYVQSILPITASRSSTDTVFKNDKVNTFNGYVKAAAQATNVTYLNVCEAVQDENGALPEDASTDGIHLQKDYLTKWIDYLAAKT